MNKEIQIKQENVLEAYNNASDENKKMLESLFSKEMFKPKDIRERIKTFGDAARAVGIIDVVDWEENYSNMEPDILAARLSTRAGYRHSRQTRHAIILGFGYIPRMKSII